jgi:hypothetical protein
MEYFIRRAAGPELPIERWTSDRWERAEVTAVACVSPRKFVAPAGDDGAALP